MTAPLLLDTCAVIWASGAVAGAELLHDQLAKAYEEGAQLWVSPITVWELGNLATRGRMGLVQPILPWFDLMLSRARLKQTILDARILAASTNLPGGIHGDPADRIIVATARTLTLRIVTRDAKILDYAARGHVLALAF